MSYCKNCGANLKDGAHFCGACGQPVSNVNTVTKSVKTEKAVNNDAQESPRSAARNSNGKRKRVNLKMIIALFIVVLIGGTYYYFDKVYFSPDKVFEGFTNAIDAKDVSKVKSYINDGQRELKATDKQAEMFINYLNENPKTYSDLYTNLKSDVDFYSYQENESESPSESNPIANLKLNGKKWGIFDEYVIEVQPYYADVVSDYDNTAIQVDGEKIGTVNDDEEKTFGPFLPGEHSITAIIEGDYGKVSQSLEFDDSNLADRTTSIKVNWSDYFFPIYTNEGDAILFVNGKSTKKSLKDLENLGPVALDGTVKVHAELKADKETIKSDTVTVKDGIYDVELYFEDVNEYEPEKESELEEKTSSEDKEESDELETEEKAEETSEEKSETSKIESVIYSHYQNITNDNFKSAYNLFSSEKRSSLSLNDWSKGLKANMSDQVTIVNVTEVNATTATAYVEMTSTDDNGDGTTLVQKWGGDWYLVKENGSWYLNKAKLEKLSSKTES